MKAYKLLTALLICLFLSSCYLHYVQNREVQGYYRRDHDFKIGLFEGEKRDSIFPIFHKRHKKDSTSYSNDTIIKEKTIVR